MIDRIQADRNEVAERILTIRARLDMLSPDADAYERLTRGADAEDASPERWHAVLRRVVARVAVDTDTVTIMARAGASTVLRREDLAVRPAREHERTGHDPRTGRFIAG
jgi:hypothetical protein